MGRAGLGGAVGREGGAGHVLFCGCCARALGGVECIGSGCGSGVLLDGIDVRSLGEAISRRDSGLCPKRRDQKKRGFLFKNR